MIAPLQRFFILSVDSSLQKYNSEKLSNKQDHHRRPSRFAPTDLILLRVRANRPKSHIRNGTSFSRVINRESGRPERETFRCAGASGKQINLTGESRFPSVFHRRPRLYRYEPKSEISRSRDEVTSRLRRLFRALETNDPRTALFEKLFFQFFAARLPDIGTSDFARTSPRTSRARAASISAEEVYRESLVPRPGGAALKNFKNQLIAPLVRQKKKEYLPFPPIAADVGERNTFARARCLTWFRNYVIVHDIPRERTLISDNNKVHTSSRKML